MVEEMNNIELEEEVIQTAETNTSDNQLNDVISFEPVAFEDSFETSEMSEVGHDMMDSPSDSGLYTEMSSFTPSVSLDQMVDIAPQAVVNPSLELEEETIPNEDNTSDDDQLDDVM